MKRKKTNPNQRSFEECVQFTIAALGNEDRQALIDGIYFDWHNTLGRWIRNNCKLWEYGTKRCVDDIVREYKAGRLTSKYLDENSFTHPELAFDMEHIPRNSFNVDRTLAHPDNCSGIIIQTIVQRLRDGTD
jgi:hypothetical protein